jgi:hypothetical protein
VVLVLLKDGKDAGWRLASGGAGRHRCAQDPAVGVVESDLLGLDRHDRHDRLACLARRRRLGGWRGSRLSCPGVSGQSRKCGHRRERHNGGSPQAPPRHGGLRHRKSIRQTAGFAHQRGRQDALPRMRRGICRHRPSSALPTGNQKFIWGHAFDISAILYGWTGVALETAKKTDRCQYRLLSILRMRKKSAPAPTDPFFGFRHKPPTARCATRCDGVPMRLCRHRPFGARSGDSDRVGAFSAFGRQSTQDT